MSALTVSSMNRNGLAMKSLPPAMVELVRLSKSLRLVTKTTGVFLWCGMARSLAHSSIAGHAGHVHVEKDEVKVVFREQLQGLFRLLDVDGFELGLFEGIDDGAAGNGLVIHDEDFGGGNLLFFRQRAAFEQEAEKIHGGGDGASGGGVDVFRLLVNFLEQGLEGGGHVGDLQQARRGRRCR